MKASLYSEAFFLSLKKVDNVSAKYKKRDFKT